MPNTTPTINIFRRVTSNAILTFVATDPVDLPESLYSDNMASDDPRNENVEEMVYYSTKTLSKLTKAEDFSFSTDRARFMIAMRWMVLYNYTPWKNAELETKRVELRKRLGFSSDKFGLMLGWFLYQQFQTLRMKGLLSQNKDRQPAYYEARRWLSRNWDGKIREQEASSSNLANTATISRTEDRDYILKRPAIDSFTNREKGHKVPNSIGSEWRSIKTPISAIEAEVVTQVHL